MNISRRGFIGAILAAGASAAIIRTPGLLMPIKPALVLQPPKIVFLNSGLTLQDMSTGVEIPIDTSAGIGLFAEMSTALAYNGNLHDSAQLRFLATPEITDRMEKESSRGVGTFFGVPMQRTITHLRAFRGIPIENDLRHYKSNFSLGTWPNNGFVS